MCPTELKCLLTLWTTTSLSPFRRWEGRGHGEAGVDVKNMTRLDLAKPLMWKCLFVCFFGCVFYCISGATLISILHRIQNIVQQKMIVWHQCSIGTIGSCDGYLFYVTKWTLTIITKNLCDSFILSNEHECSCLKKKRSLELTSE